MTDYLRIVLDENLNLTVHIAGALIAMMIAVVVLALLGWRIFGVGRLFGWWRRFEIDEAQFGIGKQKITLHPNVTDLQIVYKIWVELSTRKIGISMDLEDDVISEIYDSWYNFFSVTRELIKDVPVSRFRRKDTEQIIRLSIDVLNIGIRPHLTKWQARFRRWYEQELKKDENVALHPQDIQKNFPDFQILKGDLKQVNERLINYRQKMYELVTSM